MIKLETAIKMLIDNGYTVTKPHRNHNLSFLNNGVETLGFCDRATKILYHYGVFYIKDLIVLNEVELLNMAIRKSELTLIKESLAIKNLTLGTKL